MIIIKTEKETVYLNESTYSSVTHNKEEGIIYVYHENRGDAPIVWCGVKEVVYVNGSQQVRDTETGDEVAKQKERNDRLRDMNEELSIIAESNQKFLELENDFRLSITGEIERFKSVFSHAINLKTWNNKKKLTAIEDVVSTFSKKIKDIERDRNKRIIEQVNKNSRERHRLKSERVADMCNKIKNDNG